MSKTFLYIFLTISAFAPSSFGQRIGGNFSCSKIFQIITAEEVIKAYEKAWNNSKIYCEGYCDSNVTKLFIAIKKTIPGLHANEVNVLIISQPLGRVAESADEGVYTALKPRGERRPWKYHVVLEFRGVIFDLDYTDRPLPLPKARYFKEFFDHEMISKLVVYVVTGEEYFMSSSKYKVDIPIFMKNKQPIPAFKFAHTP